MSHALYSIGKKTTTNLPKKTWFQDIRLENSWVFFIGSNRRFLTFDSKAEIIFEHFGEVTEEIRFATCSPPVGGPPKEVLFRMGIPPKSSGKFGVNGTFFCKFPGWIEIFRSELVSQRRSQCLQEFSFSGSVSIAIVQTSNNPISLAMQFWPVLTISNKFLQTGEIPGCVPRDPKPCLGSTEGHPAPRFTQEQSDLGGFSPLSKLSLIWSSEVLTLKFIYVWSSLVHLLLVNLQLFL